MIIKNGMVLSFDHKKFIKQDIEVGDGKILHIGNELSGADVFDASGLFITPGLIDAHSHIGISEEGMGATGDDCNDYSDALTPYLSVVDAIYPLDPAFEKAIRGGVTAACICPGSDSIVGGVASTICFSGRVVDEMLITPRAAIKCSLGENPKKANLGFKSRMGNAYQLRSCLENALDYQHRKNEALRNNSYFKKDLGMENMLPVLEKKVPIHVHVHRCDDICTAIRIAREYDVKLVLIHCTDGIAIKEYLAAQGYPVIVGPTLYPASKQESWNRTFATAGELSRAGLKVCITADHDVTPLCHLSVYAAMAVRYGMDEMEALKAITRNPAEVLGIEDQKGDLREGLDADIVLWEKHPFAYDTHVRQVFISGRQMI